MKTNNIFDYMEHDIENIDEQTVLEETGVKTENVKEIFMSKLNSENKTTKKHGKKKIVVVLAAAVAAALALGTVGAGAAGSFNSVFGEHFAGERVKGVYAGGNISIETNSEYKAELLGISGDNYNAFAALSFKRADGKNFADNIEDYTVESHCMDIYPTWGDEYDPKWLETDQTNEDLLNADDMENYYVDLSPVQYLDYSFREGGINTDGFSDYKLTASDTIKGIYYIRRDSYEIIGQKMNVDLNNLYLVHDESYVGEFQVLTDANGVVDQEELKKGARTANEKIAKARETLGEHQFIHMNTEFHENEDHSSVLTYKFSVANYERLNIDLKGSWDMNYKSTEESREAVDDTFSDNGLQYQVSDINVGAFMVSAKVTVTDGELSDYDYGDGENSWLKKFENKSMKITLKNGQVLTGYIIPDTTCSNGENTFCIKSTIYTLDNDWVSVNPEEVDSIEIGGNVINK